MYIGTVNKKIKSLFYPLKYPFECHEWTLPISAAWAGAHTSRLQRWRVASNVWKIWSVRDFNPYLPLEKQTSYLLLSGRLWEL